MSEVSMLINKVVGGMISTPVYDIERIMEFIRYKKVEYEIISIDDIVSQNLIEDIKFL